MNIARAYKILGLELDASQEDVKKSYRELAKQYHPDKNKTEKAADFFRLITEAYECIQNATEVEIAKFQTIESVRFQRHEEQRLAPQDLNRDREANSLSQLDLAQILELFKQYSARNTDQFDNLNGASLIACDGQETFLGKISGYFERDSIFNPYSRYGSVYHITSIWNKYGRYGSPYSRYSPFNAFTSSPPAIYKNDIFMGFLSVSNIPKIQGYTVVDPNWLINHYGKGSR